MGPLFLYPKSVLIGTGLRLNESSRSINSHKILLTLYYGFVSLSLFCGLKVPCLPVEITFDI